ILKRIRTLSRKKVKSQPMAVGPRNALGFAKESNEQKENEIGIDLRLQLQIAGKILRCDLARTVFELQRGVKCVINFLHERDQRPNVMIAQAGARVVLLELFDEPTGIVNADVKPIVSGAKKGPGELAQ